jgi:hypothetical protein
MTKPADDILMNLMEIMADQMIADEGRTTSSDSFTVAQRKDSHRNMLDGFDIDKLLTMQDKMSRAIDRMTANQIDLEEPGVLGPEKAEELMIEILEQTDIKELLEVRRELIRAAVFAHITEEARREGRSDPEFAPGSVAAPGLGKKFVREGGNRAAPTLDETMFREALGAAWEEVYDVQVIPEQVIPEHVEYTLDPEKIMRMAEKDPQVLEALRSSLIPGSRRTPTFRIRNI